MNKRDFMKVAGSAGMLAVAPIDTVYGSRGKAESETVDIALFDPRYSVSWHFANALKGSDTTMIPTVVDMGELWYGEIEQYQQRKQAFSIAGLTTSADLFVLEMLGSGQGFSVVSRIDTAVVVSKAALHSGSLEVEGQLLQPAEGIISEREVNMISWMMVRQ